MNRVANFGIVAVLAILASPATAISASIPHLTLKELEAEGQTQVESSLVALLMEDTPTTNAQPEVPPFSLTAEWMRIETDTADPSIHTGIVGAQPAKDITYTTTPRDYEAATLDLLASRAGHRINVYGQGHATLEVTTGCATISPSDTARFSRVPLAYYPRPETTVHADRALMLDACPGEITIQGDFIISIWEADLNLTTANGTETLQSGQLSPQQTPMGTDPRPYVTRDQELYVFAQGATMALPSLTGPLYVQNLELDLNGSMTVQDARGTLDLPGQSKELQGQMSITGNLHLDLEASLATEPFSLQATGDVGAARLNGLTLQLPVVEPHGSGMTTAALGGLSVLALAIIAWHERPFLIYAWRRRQGQPVGYTAATTHQQRRGAGYWALATRAEASQRPRKARRNIRHALRLFPESLDAQVLNGILLHKQGSYAASLQVFAEIHAKMPEGHEQAEIACMCAQAAMGLQDFSKALEWLHQAARNHFATFRVEAGKPLYDLIEDDWLQSMRELPLTGRPRRIAPDPSFA